MVEETSIKHFNVATGSSCEITFFRSCPPGALDVSQPDHRVKPKKKHPPGHCPTRALRLQQHGIGKETHLSLSQVDFGNKDPPTLQVPIKSLDWFQGKS